MLPKAPKYALDLSTFMDKLGAMKSGLSIQDAITAITQLNEFMISVEEYRLYLRWWLGCVLAFVDRPYGRGEDVIEEIRQRLWREGEIKIGRSLLFECERLYRNTNGDFRFFQTWIENKTSVFGRPPTWLMVRDDLLGGRSNPAVIGREAADQRDFFDAERGIEALASIRQRAAEGNEEAQGVIVAIQQNVEALQLGGKRRKATPRSEEYLDFVRQYACIVCRNQAEAHHAIGGLGVAVKASDFGAVPLCHHHHMDLHSRGRAGFEKLYQVSLVEVAFNLLHRYVTGSSLTLDLTRYQSGA